MSSKERLFFALMPNEDVIRQINDLVSHSFDDDELHLTHIKRVQKYNYHITLLFLGYIEKELVSEIIASAQKIKLKPFELKINKTGYFQKRKVFWLGLKKPPHQELDYLLDALHINLARINSLALHGESRKFIPHVTILKKVHDLDICSKIQRTRFNISWLVDKFSLVRSVNGTEGVKYEILAEFLL